MKHEHAPIKYFELGNTKHCAQISIIITKIETVGLIKIRGTHGAETFLLILSKYLKNPDVCIKQPNITISIFRSSRNDRWGEALLIHYAIIWLKCSSAGLSLIILNSKCNHQNSISVNPAFPLSYSLKSCDPNDKRKFESGPETDN